MKVLLTLLVFFFIPSYVCSETVNYLNEDDFIAPSLTQRGGQVSGIRFINTDAKQGIAIIKLRVKNRTTNCNFSEQGKNYFTVHTNTLEPNYNNIVTGAYSAMNRNLKVTATLDENCRIINISFDR